MDFQPAVGIPEYSIIFQKEAFPGREDCGGGYKTLEQIRAASSKWMSQLSVQSRN